MRKVNASYLLARTLVLAMAAYALLISFSHQIELVGRSGVPAWQANTAPLFFDGMMILGRLGMTRHFAASTRRAGRLMMTLGAMLSLAANILAGHTIGERVWGAVVVVGFLIFEWYSGQLRPAGKVDPQTAKERAQRGAATRQAKLDAKRKQAAEDAAAKEQRRVRAADRRARQAVAAQEDTLDRELKELISGPIPPNAPVSPAPIAATSDSHPGYL